MLQVSPSAPVVTETPNNADQPRVLISRRINISEYDMEDETRSKVLRIPGPRSVGEYVFEIPMTLL